MNKYVWVIVIILALSGCQTIIQHKSSDQGPAIYGGTRLCFNNFLLFDLVTQVIPELFASNISDESHQLVTGNIGAGLEVYYPLILVWQILDLPLTLALDTLYLPYSFPNEIYYGGIRVD